MPSKMIFLMGAPTHSSLQWDESSLLSESIHPFQNPEAHDEAHWLSLKTDAVKWRLLQGPTITKAPPTKGLLICPERAQFLTTHDLATSTNIRAIEPDVSELSRFYDHSFTVHETSEISLPGASAGDSGIDNGPWTESTGSSVVSNDEGEIIPPRPSIPGGLTNLREIPSAAYLNSIIPQTMTVNLIAAIIAIRPPRRIVTRQWRRELDIVEAVVGDETRTGFGVTFWLPLSDEAPAYGCGDGSAKELRTSLMRLRPRDVVLLRTVGLSCFRERVYGQSLRRGLTKIDLLYRRQVDATDTGGIYKLRDILDHEAKNDDLPLVKVRKVRDWIRRFVDSVPDSAGGGTKIGRTVTLPPDTQEDVL
ncbi:hypothetical protein BJY01DRAFT_208151 [Aspergillus pseudoustus]|uniref:Lon N-terminal domain-containing protein n=1 Tax=Aspergillus pseudoustus TaxID=1810923 RepID=A0ABR4KJB1_9EURO